MCRRCNTFWPFFDKRVILKITKDQLVAKWFIIYFYPFLSTGERGAKVLEGEHIHDTGLNCWEYKKCGREPGGKYVEKYGICLVAIEKNCDGLNGGKNGGRSCWLWRESACAKIMKKSSIQNIRECRACAVYNSIKSKRLKQLWKNFYRIAGK
jgi:hypothetical protein